MTVAQEERVRVQSSDRPCSDGEAGHRMSDVVVITRMGHYSAFSGYRFTSTSRSLCHCLNCKQTWRTGADYVSMLSDGDFL